MDMDRKLYIVHDHKNIKEGKTLDLTSHPVCQSAPGSLHIISRESPTKPSLETGILVGGGRSKVNTLNIVTSESSDWSSQTIFMGIVQGWFLLTYNAQKKPSIFQVPALFGVN